jgi:uncharacterized membrane protein YbhN (UPF0104 family)
LDAGQSQTMSKQRILRFGATVAGQVLMFATLYVLWIRFREQWPLIASDLSRMRVLPATGALFSTLALLLLMSVGWTFALHAVGVSISIRNGFSIYYQTNIFHYLPGAVWHLPGRAFLCQQRGISLIIFAQSAFFELFFLLGCGTMLAGWGMAAYLSRPEFLALSVAAAGALGLVIAWPERLLVLVRRQTVPPSEIHRPALLVMLLIYALVWLAYGGAITLLLYALPGTQPPPLVTMVITNTAAWAVGFLSFSPAGMGVRELSLSVMLGAGLSAAAVVASLTQRVMELCLEGLLWGVAKLAAKYR